MFPPGGGGEKCHDKDERASTLFTAKPRKLRQNISLIGKHTPFGCEAEARQGSNICQFSLIINLKNVAAVSGAHKSVVN